MRRKTNETYDKELEEIQPLVIRLDDYVGALKPITHKCSKGHIFKARPSQLLSGYTCKECSGRKLNSARYDEKLLYLEIDILRVDDYVNSSTPILHECFQGHQWLARPDNIVRGHGCPTCSGSGFNKQKDAIFYYIKIEADNNRFYKIGITNRSISERFKKDRDKVITPLLEKHFSSGIEAYDYEQSLLLKYYNHRVSFPGFLQSGGNSELFKFDVLGLDK